MRFVAPVDATGLCGRPKIQLAKTTPEKEAYLKRVLANMGAVNKGLPCGVHVSLSIDDRVVNMIWEKYQSRFNSKEAVRNHLYILLARFYVTGGC